MGSGAFGRNAFGDAQVFFREAKAVVEAELKMCADVVAQAAADGKEVDIDDAGAQCEVGLGVSAGAVVEEGEELKGIVGAGCAAEVAVFPGGGAACVVDNSTA